MEANQIVALLIGKLPDPSEAIFTITIKDLVTAIVQRIGDRAAMLTPEDILLARDEVQAAIEHYFDERDFIDLGLESWEIVRELQ